MDLSRYAGYTKAITRYFSASLIPMVLNLLITPLVALAMSPEDFATVGYFTSFNTLITPVIMFYMLHYYNKRYFELDEEGRLHLKALLFKSLIVFSFAVAVVCLVLLVVYMTFFTSNSFRQFPFLYMVVLGIPLTGIYNLELAEYKMRKKSREYMNLSLVKGLMAVAFTVLFVVLARWGAFGKLLAPMLADLGFFIYLLRAHGDLWKIKTSPKELLPVLKFCAPLTVGAALGYFSNGYDKAALEKLGDVNEFGYYCIGASIAGYLSVFTSSLSSTFQPDTYEAIIKRNNGKLAKVIALRWVLTLAVVAVFILLCPYIIYLLTAGKYVAATRYARIFSCIQLTNCIYYVINDYTIARGKPSFYLITTAIGSALIVLLMPLFINKWAYEGAAMLMVCSFLILSIINVILLLISHKCESSSC